MDNENIINLIASEGSPVEIPDAIKNALFAIASEKIDNVRPLVASSMFGGSEQEYQQDRE